MKRTLQLSELAPYLPYGVQCRFSTDEIYTIIGVVNENVWLKEMTYAADLFACKLILRTLRDFNATVMPDEMANDYLSLKNCPINGFSHLQLNEYNNLLIYFQDHQSHYSIYFDALPLIQFLYKWHFDVFGLIDDGLAIDINTI